MTCILCGCSESEPCVDAVTGETCAWLEFAPGATTIDGVALCSFCAEDELNEYGDVEFHRRLHEALGRGLDEPSDSERDAPRVEIVGEASADRFLRERRERA